MPKSAQSAVSRQDAFIDKYTDFALAVAEVSGIAPEVVLGQTALETGWGKSVAGGNMFGIKGAGQNVVTHEDYGNGLVKTTESFRAYNNPLDSFMDYGRLMDNSRYGHIGTNQTVDQQIASIGKSGYATDRNYAGKLSGVVDRIQASRAFQNKVVGNATASIPMAETFLGDVGLPVNRIDVSSIPDITPASAGFSLDGATLPADLSMDFSQYDTPVSLPDFAAPNMGTMPTEMDMGTFNDVFDAGFPSQSVEAPGGFAAGFDAGPWGTTPDFSAPSLTERNAVDAFGNAMEVRTNTAPDLTNEALAAGLMAELAPQTAPQAPIAPAPVASAPAQSFSSPPAMGDFDEFGPNFPAASTPQPVAQVPSVPSVSLPSAPAPTTRTQQQVAKDYDLPSFDLPDMGLPSMPTIRDVGATFGLMDPTAKTGFMDAMANPQIAQGWSPGFLDTRLGKATTGAATGFLTGGPFGAVTNGLWSGLGIGDMIGNAFDRYANAYANLSPLDFAAFMADGNPYDREPTRMDNSGNATVGDGSWGSQSGVNDNNPQGIL